jgi:NAD(P)-dependent dehydrogenase (short-subunit alcohol dehydrogenase family)
MSDAARREAFEINVLGAWRLTAALVPLMRVRRYGRIVNVSSEAGSLASMGAA